LKFFEILNLRARRTHSFFKKFFKGFYFHQYESTKPGGDQIHEKIAIGLGRFHIESQTIGKKGNLFFLNSDP
jgi:hypothetical protein